MVKHKHTSGHPDSRIYKKKGNLWVAKSEDMSPHPLPVIKLGQKYYFIDEHLKELRNVKNPHDTQPL